MTSEMKALCIKNASSVAGAAMFAKAPDITPTYDKKSRLTNTVYTDIYIYISNPKLGFNIQH